MDSDPHLVGSDFQTLRTSLGDFRKGGHDFMLDAAVAKNPQMPADRRMVVMES